MSMERREFLRTAGLAMAASVAGAAGVVVGRRQGRTTGDATGPGTVRRLTTLSGVPPQPNEDSLIRMQRDLVRAMAKPVEARAWVMLIDVRKCIGCDACSIGCVAENRLPPGVVYRPVMKEERGQFPNVHLEFTPRPCMQCENPPCVPVCPVRATWRRPDGVVTIDYDRCIGCRYCLTACPYGARTADFGAWYTDRAALGTPSGEQRPTMGPQAPYERQPSYEYAKHWTRAGHRSPIGNARKCHFCLHRLDVGQLPMCVTTCVGRATYFGDREDPKSLAAELLTSNNVHTLLPHLGTRPRVFYIT